MERLNSAIEYVMEFLSGVPLDAVTLKNYRRYCRDIVAYCADNGIERFDDSEVERFASIQKTLHENGEFGYNRFCQLRKTAVLLGDQILGRELVWGRRSYGQKLNEGFERVLLQFSDCIGQTLSPNTCKGAVSKARLFLRFLESDGVSDIKTLTAKDFKRFVEHRAKQYPQSLKHVIGGLKRFCSFINDIGLVEIDAERCLARPAPRRVRLLPCFKDDEATAILTAVDRSTPLGKRDYAILKVALGTGLRCVDILGLKKSDIDWETNAINVFQSKTNVCGQIPLLPDVGNAIAEYILKARPSSASPYVFLRNRMPYDRLSAGGHDILKRYIEKAGIAHEAGDGKSFHAFRRTVGTRLVKAKVPLPSVAQVLIHGSIDSTKRYIALDDDTLRICCLDISEYAITKEGGLS